jgi:hypothetical protein
MGELDLEFGLAISRWGMLGLSGAKEVGFCGAGDPERKKISPCLRSLKFNDGFTLFSSTGR